MIINGLVQEKNAKDDNGYINIKVKKLIEWNEPNGEVCIVSDRITKEGWKAGYMYREKPNSDYPDSGWRLYAGDEDEEYSNDPNNCHVFALNTVCNYDPEIIPYLHSPVGTCLIRVKGGRFITDDGTQPIVMEKQSGVG
ncbi:DUF2185 domain-containing protein [Ruminococcus sp. Marseille-P6503]|uniref:DUF2185 domain-containing protein n=1 Tax=Ruminococcus sp. Marseille-P6503 TaxID=2364796 RepID=UPI001FA96BDD|nr:DUF2185 domain-containing protein [Ruminococcus sp. Marseille-P6503]